MKRLYCAETTVLSYFVAEDSCGPYELARIGRGACERMVREDGIDEDDVEVSLISHAMAMTIDASTSVYVPDQGTTVGDFLDAREEEEDE